MKENDNVHAGHRERLRNSIIHGNLSTFEDYQLLEFLLTYTIPRKDTNVLAHKLINQFGSLPNVLDSEPEYLMNVDGIGKNSAVFLSLLPRILEEYSARKIKKKSFLQNTLKTVNYCIDLLKDKVLEEIYVIMLDDSFKVINHSKIATGTTNRAYASTRRISELALKYNAHFMVLAHNHPQGEPKPSDMDDIFTKTVVMSLALNEIEVTDHIIVGKDSSYYSYRENGLIEKYIKEILTN